MIFAMGIILLLIGMGMTTMDLFVPVVDPMTGQLVAVSNLFGMMFLFIGILVLGVRTYQTGIGVFLDLPKSNSAILFHQRRGKNPNKAIMKAKLLDLDYLKSNDKLFKDTGGGFRIAGHDCRNTHETIAFDMPDWLVDYFYKVKTKYKLRNYDQFKELIEELKKLEIRSYDNKVTLEEKLKNIKLLEPLMKEEKFKEQILNMDFDKLKNLDIICCDGITHHGEEVEEFIESATPNEVDTLVKQKYLNDRMKQQNYREPGTSFNYANLINVGIGMMFAVLATIILMSYLGGS